MQEWYLGWEKVSCLERCPQFRSDLIEREVPLHLHNFRGRNARKKVSCLERCPQFRSVLIEREVPLYVCF